MSYTRNQKTTDAKLQRGKEHLNSQGCAARSSLSEAALFQLYIIITVIRRQSCEQLPSLYPGKAQRCFFSAPISCAHWKATKIGDNAQKGITAAKNAATLQPRSMASPLGMLGFFYSLTPICFQQQLSGRREACAKDPVSFLQQEWQLKSSKGTQQTPGRLDLLTSLC